MRRSRKEAEGTRRRIIEAAAEKFREKGIAETPLNDLMLAAGLETPGGFYKHFESKQQLLEESLEFGIAEILGKLDGAVSHAAPEDRLEAIVSSYLSPKHRDSVARSCPLSSMGTELARLEGSSKQVAVAGLKRIISMIAKEFKGVLPPDQARKRATAAIAAMVGGMVLSRIADNPQWSNSILAESRKAVLQRQ